MELESGIEIKDRNQRGYIKTEHRATCGNRLQDGKMQGAGHADVPGVVQVPGNRADDVPCEQLQINGFLCQVIPRKRFSWLQVTTVSANNSSIISNGCKRLIWKGSALDSLPIFRGIRVASMRADHLPRPAGCECGLSDPKS